MRAGRARSAVSTWRRRQASVVTLAAAAWMLYGAPATAQARNPSAGTVVLRSNGIEFRMELARGRYAFAADGHTVVAADGAAGVLLAGSLVSFKADGSCADAVCHLSGTSAAGEQMRLTVRLAAHRAELIAEPQQPGEEVRFVTAGAAPAYGLADQAILNNFSTLTHKRSRKNNFTDWGRWCSSIAVVSYRV